jgi:hypothetical protein
MGGMEKEETKEKSTEYDDLSTHSIPDDQIIINALQSLLYTDLVKLIKCKQEKTIVDGLDTKILQLAKYIKEATIREYMKEWVDIYDIIAQVPDKTFISNMKNDVCEKVKANDCFIDKLPIGKKHCRYYQSTNDGPKCYSLSRFKRYNIFDAELSKIINSRTYIGTEYKIVYGYNNGRKYSGRGRSRSRIDNEADFYWRYSLIISSKTDVRYILFHTGTTINIKMVEDDPKWQAAMNELIYLLLEDEQKYTGMYIFCGHSMGCSLMLFLAYTLFTEYNAFFMSKCICFGSGQTTFFRKEMKDNIFFTSTNIYIFELIGDNDDYDENDKSSGPKWLIDPAILWPYYRTKNLTDEDLEFIYIPFFIAVIYKSQREYGRMLIRGEKQSYIWQDMLIAEIGVDYHYTTLHQWGLYKIALNRYIKLPDLDSAYYDLNVILKSSSENELTNNTKWENRLCSTFLEKIHLYDWNWNDPDKNVMCSYTYHTIQDMSKIDTNPMESISNYKSLYIAALENLKRSTTKENKFCALYGAPIMYRKKEAEPHAYIIYKDTNSEDFYVYNGRANLIVVDGTDLANDHIAYSWGVENIKISPIKIAIQSYADGFMCDNDENITRSKSYKGLCFPVVVVCAYLFMKYDNYKFEDVINYLSTKSPDELSSLFLKMNNHLADTIKEIWF